MDLKDPPRITKMAPPNDVGFNWIWSPWSTMKSYTDTAKPMKKRPKAGVTDQSSLRFNLRRSPLMSVLLRCEGFGKKVA
jgi:hypothetical protein